MGRVTIAMYVLRNQIVDFIRDFLFLVYFCGALGGVT